MGAPPHCQTCGSDNTTVVSGDVICRACGERRGPTVEELVSPGDIAAIFAGAALHFPTNGFIGLHHPTLEALQEGLGGLSERRVRNRLPSKLNAGITLLEEVEQITAENLLQEWDWDGRTEDDMGTGQHLRDMPGHRAVDALDRILGRLRHFEETWESQGRKRETLWRTPWEFAGRDVARDLPILTNEREFLQAARTLLEERVGAAR